MPRPLTPFHIRITFLPGKTAAIFYAAGPGATTATESLEEDKGDLLLPLAGGLPPLRLVYTYKHVGTMATAKASVGPEVARRATSALAAHVPLARRIFGNAFIAEGVIFFAARRYH